MITRTSSSPRHRDRLHHACRQLVQRGVRHRTRLSGHLALGLQVGHCLLKLVHGLGAREVLLGLFMLPGVAVVPGPYAVVDNVFATADEEGPQEDGPEHLSHTCKTLTRA